MASDQDTSTSLLEKLAGFSADRDAEVEGLIERIKATTPAEIRKRRIDRQHKVVSIGYD